MQVNLKTRLRVMAEARPEIAASLKAARKALGLTQAEMAQTLGSSQGAMTRWERAIDSPPTSAFLVIADLVPDAQKAYWLDLAGVRAAPPSPRDPRQIPLLHDAVAAGTGRAVDESQIDYFLTLPPQLLPTGGKLQGVRVVGDSMSPILEEGYIAVIDVVRRDPRELEGRMIAAREGDAVTIKWLRKQGKLLLLVPQNTSERHPIRVMTEDGDFGIVGEVVLWIGEPPSPRK